MPNPLLAHRPAILDIAKKYGASNLRLFGSILRNDFNDQSDVDLLVDLDPGRSLLDHVGLKQELEALLKRDVDVVVEGGVSPHLEERILSEAVPL